MEFNGIKDKETNKIVYIYSMNITVEENLLGRGYLSDVWLAHNFDQDNNKVGEKVAYKRILYRYIYGDLDYEAQKELYKKVEQKIKIVMEKYEKIKSCPFIVKIENIYSRKGEIKLILEKCDNMPLKQYITERKNEKKRFSRKEVLHFLDCILKGVAALHEQEIWLTHRLNTSRILMKNDDLKISGLIVNSILPLVDPKQGYKDHHPHVKGYQSPQLINNEKEYLQEKNDVWSIGIILYRLLKGKFPELSVIVGEDPKEIELSDIYLPPVSGHIEKLLAWIFSIKEAERPTVNEILESKLYR